MLQRVIEVAMITVVHLMDPNATGSRKAEQGLEALVDILDVLRTEIRPGVSTGDLDQIAARMMADAGAEPSFLGYGSNPPFPGVICASINDEVVHGIPSPRRRLADGDVVSIDIGCIVDGWHADCARTWTVGRVPREVHDCNISDLCQRHPSNDFGATRISVNGAPGTALRRVIYSYDRRRMTAEKRPEENHARYGRATVTKPIEDPSR